MRGQQREHAARLHQMPGHLLGIKQATLHAHIVANPTDHGRSDTCCSVVS